MLAASVLSIDYGSSYTKVAVRSGIDAEAKLLYRLDGVAGPEGEFCVPSVVAKVRRRGQDEFVAGWAAADLQPSDDVEVFQNIKAMVMSPRSSDVDRTAGARLLRHLFAHIRQVVDAHLREQGVVADVLRVCIPYLGEDATLREVMSGIIAEAGWANKVIELEYEPETNVLGVLSRGVNKSHVPSVGPYRNMGPYPHYKSMFEQSPLLRAIRMAARPNAPLGEAHCDICVVDVGAFTTDLALVRFDANFANPPVIVQESTVLGLAELDTAVLQVLPEGHRMAIAHSFSVWEREKQRLYRSEAVALVDPASRKRIVVGDGAQMQVIEGEVTQFASRVLDAVSRFAERNGLRTIQGIVITGGGSQVPAIAQRVVAWSEKRSEKVYDLASGGAPESKVPMIRDEMGAYHADQGASGDYKTRSLELIRGGSAIGGCSLALGFVPDGTA